MIRLLPILSLVFIVVARTSNGQAVSSEVANAATQAAVVGDTNTVRANVQPAPASGPLGTLQYSSQLASNALAWVKQCQFVGLIAQHSSTSFRTIPVNNFGTIYVGENLYWSYTVGTTCQIPAQQTIVDSTNSWASEASVYTVGCSNFTGQVGHLTQQVDNRTSLIGCAAACCIITTGGTTYDVELVGCQYAPGGNIGGFSTPYTPTCAPACPNGEQNAFANSRPACNAAPTTTASTTTTTTTTTPRPTTTTTTTTTTPRPTTTTTTTPTPTTTTSTTTTTMRPTGAPTTTTTTTTAAPTQNFAACPSRVLRGAVALSWFRDDIIGSCYMFVRISTLGNTGITPDLDVLRLTPFSTIYGSSHELIVSSDLENRRVAALISAIVNGVGGINVGSPAPTFFKLGLEFFSDDGEWDWTQSQNIGPSYRCFGPGSNGQCLNVPASRTASQECAYYGASRGTNERFWVAQSCDNYSSMVGYFFIVETPIIANNGDGATLPAVPLPAGARRQNRLIQRAAAHVPVSVLKDDEEDDAAVRQQIDDADDQEEESDE